LGFTAPLCFVNHISVDFENKLNARRNTLNYSTITHPRPTCLRSVAPAGRELAMQRAAAPTPPP
jgi:hypothetical protein